MGLIVPPGGLFGFQFSVSNVDATRPAAAFGTSVVPGNNTYGTYTAILSALAQDVYGLLINFNSGFVSANCKDSIATIGIDPSGGSSYTDTISHLLCSDTLGFGLEAGVSYYFPLFVKAGSTVAVKVSVNNATVGTIRCIIQAFGQPTDSRLVRAGTFVETLGANTAASNGTAVTSGTTSIGTWTSLGTTTKQTWWHQVGFGCSSNNMNGGIYSGDLSVGDGTSQDIFIRKAIFRTQLSETISYGPLMGNNVRSIPGSSTLYGRLQCSTSVDTGLSMIAYALGG